MAKAEAEKEREQGQSDFAYTIAAARRSEQRRLLNFIRLADYMVGAGGGVEGVRGRGGLPR